MGKTNYLIEFFVYYSIKGFGSLVRSLPLPVALGLGRLLGHLAYLFDIKHRILVYANLKIAFAKTKSPEEIRKIAKNLFTNYGQNLIELLRLPLLTPQVFSHYVTVEGKEYVEEALKQGKGVILLAMHFGSWELASIACTIFGRPYKVIVKPQKRFTRLDDLLNTYRAGWGSIIIERGLGTREFIKSLKNNEIVGMVVDQGGKNGILVPFFERQASMSDGAIRVGMKLGVPLCFAIIHREKGPYHRIIFHKSLDLTQTGEGENDLKINLLKVTKMMEEYIQRYPSEYMWFYKIWKYSKQSTTLILNDGKTGHLRQSQAVDQILKKVLMERNIENTTQVINVIYKNRWAQKLLSVLSIFANAFMNEGRIGFMKWFLSKDSFEQLVSIKADFVISCGSAAAPVNYLLSVDQQAKSICILKPSLLSYRRFDLVILPEHDKPLLSHFHDHILIIKGAPNLINSEYLQQQTDQLIKQYSHLKFRNHLKIGLLLGGDTKKSILSEQKVKMVLNQIKEIAHDLNADILVTTSRRTSKRLENLLVRELKKHSNCQLMILANRNNIPEAVGGILGLSDIIVVSGDSISMISEAVSSGKGTIVFPLEQRLLFFQGKPKHLRFIETLHACGYILSSDVRDLRQSIASIAKNKVQTKQLNDYQTILEGLKQLI